MHEFQLFLIYLSNKDRKEYCSKSSGVQIIGLWWKSPSENWPWNNVRCFSASLYHVCLVNYLPRLPPVDEWGNVYQINKPKCFLSQCSLCAIDRCRHFIMSVLSGCARAGSQKTFGFCSVMIQAWSRGGPHTNPAKHVWIIFHNVTQEKACLP